MGYKILIIFGWGIFPFQKVGEEGLWDRLALIQCGVKYTGIRRGGYKRKRYIY
jgi:hypothetical protein